MRERVLLRAPRPPNSWATNIDGSEGGSVVRVFGSDVILRSAQRRYWMSILPEFGIRQEILERVARTRARIGPGPCVGVQIRSQPNAHADALARSPISWFTEQLRELLAAFPSTKVFASCDSPQIEQQLAAEFGSAVYFLEGKSGFNTADGVKDAFCDLLLLGEMDYLLLTHKSSMGTLARYLQRTEAFATSVDARGLTWRQLLAPLDGGSPSGARRPNVSI